MYPQVEKMEEGQNFDEEKEYKILAHDVIIDSYYDIFDEISQPALKMADISDPDARARYEQSEEFTKLIEEVLEKMKVFLNSIE